MGMNSKDLSRLGPAAQQQVLQKMASHQIGKSAEARSAEPRLGKQKRGREEKTAPKNKYNAKPTDVVMPNGTVRQFSSEKEANRFRELDLLQRAGEITDLRCQVPFLLIPYQKRDDGKSEQPCKYIADFVYRDGCRQVVEDVKGYTDTSSAAYKLYTVKRKLMLQVWGITIREV